MKKYATLAMAAFALMAVAYTSASAQTQEAIAGVINHNQQSNVVWNGSTLVITGSSANASSDLGLGSTSSATVTFSNLTQTNYIAPSILNGNTFTQDFSGGTFTVTDNNNGNKTLISGAFTGAQLSAVNGSTSGGIQFAGVTFNAGGQYVPAGMDLTDAFGLNALSVEFNTQNGGTLSDNGLGTTLANYSGHDGITWSSVVTTGVPEPASFATFGIGAFMLLALGLIAKRRSLSVSL